MSYKQMGDESPHPSAPSGAPRDPFYVVKEKVQDLMASLLVDFDRWRELLETTNTATHGDFAPLTQAVKVAVKKLTIDLNDLSQTIRIVSENRLRFKDIDDKELETRRKFVNDMKARVEEYENTLNSTRTKGKLERDARDAVFARDDQAKKSAKEREREAVGNDFVSNHAQAQGQIHAQQDVVLDDMHGAIQRLGDISGNIKVELDVQNEMLKEFDDEMGEAQSNMTKVLKKVDKLLGKSDTGRLCCILILFVIVIVLIIAIVYT